MMGVELNTHLPSEAKNVHRRSLLYTVPVILVTPPNAAAAPTIAYNPGVIQVDIDRPHDVLNIDHSGL